MASDPHFMFKLDDVNLGLYKNLAEAGNAEPARVSERLARIRDVKTFFAFDDRAVAPLAGAFLSCYRRRGDCCRTVDE